MNFVCTADKIYTYILSWKKRFNRYLIICENNKRETVLGFVFLRKIDFHEDIK